MAVSRLGLYGGPRTAYGQSIPMLPGETVLNAAGSAATAWAGEFSQVIEAALASAGVASVDWQSAFAVEIEAVLRSAGAASVNFVGEGPTAIWAPLPGVSTDWSPKPDSADIWTPLT